MYMGFNIKGIIFPDREKYVEIGKKLYYENRHNLDFLFEKYNIEEDLLNADKIMDDWFPQINAQVFISHSHKDLDEVLALAGWLKEIADVSVFVDSCVWGHCEHLITELEKKYMKSNSIKAHVYVMLNSALMKMIDKTECFMFLNTSHSLCYEDANIQETDSQWIYSELLTAHIIRRRCLSEHRKTLCHGGIDGNMRYTAYLDRLSDVEQLDLFCFGKKIEQEKEVWGSTWGGERFLDILYKECYENK